MINEVLNEILDEFYQVELNIYLNKFSTQLNDIFDELVNTNNHINLCISEYDKENELYNFKSKIKIIEEVNKKFNLAILIDANKDNLTSTLEKLKSDARCIILGKLDDDVLNLNTYKLIHQNRTEVFFSQINPV